MTFGRNQANLSASFLDDGVGSHRCSVSQQAGISAKSMESHTQRISTYT